MRNQFSLALVLGLVGAQSIGCDRETTSPVEATPVDSVAQAAPPPITGGTLLVTASGRTAVASDTDADRVLVVDLEGAAIEHTVELEPGDEPGRIVEGPEGTVFVALRRGGAVATISLADGHLERRAACPAPRGLAYDAAHAELHVACAGGELVTLADGVAEPRRVVKLDPDLRDVVLDGTGLVVTRFRSAELLRLDAAGQLTSRTKPATRMLPPGFLAQSPDPVPFAPAVAWRMRQHPTLGTVVVHQLGLAAPLPTGPSPVGQSYYAADCGSTIVQSAGSVFASGDTSFTPEPAALGAHPLMTDFAFGPDNRVAYAVAGGGYVIDGSLDASKNPVGVSPAGCAATGTVHMVPGEPHSVAFAGDTLVAQTRQPARLWLRSASGEESTIFLAEESRRSVGHALFHRAAGPFSPIACASCHPEGSEDGRVWQFEKVGARRTQSLAGGVTETAPHHWDGDLSDMHDLMGEVFVNRMGGVLPEETRIDSLAAWLDTISPVPASRSADDPAAARGEALFHSSAVGCASCHSGDQLTNNATVNVGTGKAFQVPSLVGVAHRAPLMHDGCATSLLERFTNPACGGGDAHGKTSHLAPSELADLAFYLETL